MAVRSYTGVGSRSTPPEIQQHMQAIAAALQALGYRLRSGHAPGADQAFERGAGLDADIFLPWPNFEGGVPILGRSIPNPHPDAFTIAARYHPRWYALNHGVRCMHARNVHQVLGETLDQPSDLLICWTPAAAAGGGTGQAIRIARDHHVPVFDLADPRVLDRVTATLAVGLVDGPSSQSQQSEQHGSASGATGSCTASK